MTLPLLSKWPGKPSHSALALALSVVLGASCNAGSNDSASPGLSLAGAGSSEAGAAGEGELGPSGIMFVNAGAGGDPTLYLDPKETRELTVQTDPPGSYLVRFALPGSGTADPGDAVLDRNQTQSDENGVAHVVLTAPSMPAGFSVRASSGTRASVYLGVAVTSVGHTTLSVVPSYSGKRTVALWTATATGAPGVNCNQLSGNPPPDGVLSVSALPGHPLNIPRVPVGVDVVVTLRAGHYIGGCATLAPLSEGDDNMVLVYASDRPLNLGATELDLAFGPTDSPQGLDKELASSAVLAESALLANAPNDVAALLDEMQNATPSADRSAFVNAREQGGWDAALTSAFGKSADGRLRVPVKRWIDAGLATFDSPSTFSGTLGSAGADALFRLSTVAGLAPNSAGFADSFPATWSTDSSDTLLLGTELSWVPSRLVTALAAGPALLEYPGTTRVEEALAASVDCQLVSNVLLSYGTSSGSALYTGCDASCGSSTCELALSSIWKRATLASGTNVASLTVTATGSTQVGDAAEISVLDGSWVGQLSDGANQSTVSGALSARSVGQ